MAATLVSALDAVRDLHPRRVIPIHRGLVQRSPLLRTCQSAERFASRVRAAGLETDVVIQGNGTPYVIE